MRDNMFHEILDDSDNERKNSERTGNDRISSFGVPRGNGGVVDARRKSSSKQMEEQLSDFGLEVSNGRTRDTSNENRFVDSSNVLQHKGRPEYSKMAGVGGRFRADNHGESNASGSNDRNQSRNGARIPNTRSAEPKVNSSNRPSKRTKKQQVNENQLVLDLFMEENNTPAYDDEVNKKKNVNSNSGITTQRHELSVSVAITPHLSEYRKPQERLRDNIEAIRTVKTLKSQERVDRPTQEEVNTVAKYVGWGGLAEAFEDTSTKWLNEKQQLKELLTEEEYSDARASVLTSFYTPMPLASAIWNKLENMGYEGGRILDPAAGTGRFINAIPEEKSNTTTSYAVELDRLSADIAKILNPNTQVLAQGYEATKFADNSFDVVITNVPFGNYSVSDPRHNSENLQIHDYYFAKALDHVKPGGIIAFITSNGTLDKKNSKPRQRIAERAEFLGAIRLPESMFAGDAGTKVISDVIFLKKREYPIHISKSTAYDLEQEMQQNISERMKAISESKELEYEEKALIRQEITEEERKSFENIVPRDEITWLVSDEYAEGVSVNRYFQQNPQAVIGTMSTTTGQFGNKVTVINDSPMVELVNEVEKTLEKVVHGSFSQAEIPNDNLSISADPLIGDMSYGRSEGSLYYRNGLTMLACEGSQKILNRIRDYIDLRDAGWEYLGLQGRVASDNEIEAARITLNEAYDHFVKHHGYINDKANLKALKDDASYYVASSWEVKTEEGYEKALMFSERTVRPAELSIHAQTPKEALMASMNVNGYVDLEYMSQLLSASKQELIDALSEEIYFDPTKNHYVIANEYLSGNIKKKIEEAAGLDEPFRSKNIAALQKVMPKALSAEEIIIELGATWIPSSLVEDFMYETLNINSTYRNDSYSWYDPIRLIYVPENASWSITNKSSYSSPEVNNEYGTPRRNAFEILEASLNMRDLVVKKKVYDPSTGKEKEILDRDATLQAQERQDKVKQAFREWIYADEDRKNQVVRLYNDKFRVFVPREYDGSQMEYPGMSTNIEPYPHQRNAIARQLYGGNTLLWHAVGAGKTFEMAIASQESKRLGLTNKSLFVVPKHLVEQWGVEYLRVYPQAQVLITKDEDFAKNNRQAFMSKISSGAWDAVIMSDSQFAKIPLSPSRERGYIQDEINKIVAGIERLKEDEAPRMTIKQLESKKATLSARFDKIKKHDQDKLLTFEELGVDRLFVDEAHHYKNLMFDSKISNVAGISSRPSQRASDMYYKVKYINEITNNRGVTFATGTAISNSMSEAFTMQRYLQEELLAEFELDYFDKWISLFGKKQTALELKPEGTGFHMKSRFTSFNNIPELVSIFSSVCDIQTSEMIDLPDRPDGHWETVVIEPTELQQQMIANLAERAEEVRNGNVDPAKDNMLKITGEGRKIALDPRLVNSSLPSGQSGKVEKLIENVVEIYRQTVQERSAQVIFCDLSTPKADGYSVYQEIKDRLMEKGIPEPDIAFIHDTDTASGSDKKKKELFDKVNAGQIRVLLGSTEKLGEGTNIQRRLKALHHLDCPWRPSDLEQREGRIIRQGNLNQEVLLYRYVTKGTFDAYMYQTIENKQKFVGQVFSGDATMRTASDVDEAALTYAEIKALCAGDERVKERLELQNRLPQLQSYEKSYIRSQQTYRHNIEKVYPAIIAEAREYIEHASADSQLLAKQAEAFTMKVDDVVYTERVKAAEALNKAIVSTAHLYGDSAIIGEYKGFQLSANFDKFSEFNVAIEGRGKYMIKAAGASAGIGTISRIDHELERIATRIETYENRIREAERNIVVATANIGKQFEYEDELKEVKARLAVLDEIMEREADAKVLVAEDEPDIEDLENELSTKYIEFDKDTMSFIRKCNKENIDISNIAIEGLSLNAMQILGSLWGDTLESWSAWRKSKSTEESLERISDGTADITLEEVKKIASGIVPYIAQISQSKQAQFSKIALSMIYRNQDPELVLSKAIECFPNLEGEETRVEDPVSLSDVETLLDNDINPNDYIEGCIRDWERISRETANDYYGGMRYRKIDEARKELLERCLVASPLLRNKCVTGRENQALIDIGNNSVKGCDNKSNNYKSHDSPIHTGRKMKEGKRNERISAR